ncbi:MAG: hypothetical protein MNPFHGCM_02630 [Gemmatimonadaceae bacterium]|nr:hypothetical protein [Gemmatimonadaceae bacterium]
MLTALSSAAAPRASLDELLVGLARHGLTALELRLGDGHAIGAVDTDAAVAAAARLARENVRVVGLLDRGGAMTESLPRVVDTLRTRWLLDGALPLGTRLECADRADAAGMPVALVVRGPDAAAEARDVRSAGHSVVWEAHPAQAPLGALCDRILEASDDMLVGVRLCGGGPEGTLHEGRGIGAVVGRLVVAGFNGALTLAPSDRKYHVLWETWIGRRGGWGCGSKVTEPIEQLQRTASIAEDIA